MPGSARRPVRHFVRRCTSGRITWVCKIPFFADRELIPNPSVLALTDRTGALQNCMSLTPKRKHIPESGLGIQRNCFIFNNMAERVGFEFTRKRSFNNIERTAGTVKAMEDSGKQGKRITNGSQWSARLIRDVGLSRVEMGALSTSPMWNHFRRITQPPTLARTPGILSLRAFLEKTEDALICCRKHRRNSTRFDGCLRIALRSTGYLSNYEDLCRVSYRGDSSWDHRVMSSEENCKFQILCPVQGPIGKRWVVRTRLSLPATSFGPLEFVWLLVSPTLARYRSC